ncbi:Uncharacterised protein [Klebsiella pneumoniae]|nr:Uncharacterised protein [Klebsiella pneumoniae]
MRGIEFVLQIAAVAGQRIAQNEIAQRHKGKHFKRLISDVGQHRPCLGQLHKADNRCQRRAFDHLYCEPDGRRDGNAQRLRRHHPVQGLAEAQPETARGFPLAFRQRANAAEPDIQQKGAGVERQGDRGGGPRRDVDAEQRHAKECQKQLHQQRRALEQLNIPADQPFHLASAGEAQQQ